LKLDVLSGDWMY